MFVLDRKKRRQKARKRYTPEQAPDRLKWRNPRAAAAEARRLTEKQERALQAELARLRQQRP